MPVDPTISLNVTGGRSGMADPNYTAGSATNPLSMVQSYAQTQNELNKNTLFKQQNAARQRFGQIAANSANMAEAVETASKDPAVAPYIPDIVNTMSDTMKRVQEFKGLKSTQTHDALTHTMDSLVGGLTKPDSVRPNFQTKLQTIYDPEIRSVVGKAGSSIIDGLTDGLDKLDSAPGQDGQPSPRDAEYARRLFAAGGATGTLGVMNTIAGAADQIETAGRNGSAVTQPGVRGSAVPTILGPAGGFRPAGNPLTQGFKPQVAPVGGVPFGGPGGAPANGAGTGASPAREPLAESPAAAEIGADGKPLFAKGFKIPSTDNRTIGNVPVGPAGTIADGLAKKFADSNAPKDSQNTLGLLSQQDADLDKLMQTGGFTQPGAGGEQRIAIAKTLNTISGILGGKPLVDTTAIGAGENAIKNIHTLSGNLLNQMYGVQREAALTIANIAKAVPGIDNTYLGGKMITDMLRAGAHRSAEQYNFDNEWQGKRHGDLTGSEAEFARQHPMSDYVKPVLDKYGMNKDGFKSATAVKKAVADGWLTKDQAYAILNSSNFKE